MVNYHVGSPTALFVLGRQISDYPPAFGFRTKLTGIPLCYLFFIASSLSPHLACFLAHLSALRSASYQSSSFPLGRLGRLGYWSSHQWCNVNGKRSCCRLVRIVFVE